MLKIRRILFPVDFSETSKQTAPSVAALARRFGSEVILIHALDVTSFSPVGSLVRPVTPMCYEQVMYDHRESDLSGFAPGVFEGLEVTRMLQQGDPAAVIKQCVEEKRVDLVVQPTHGLGTFRSLLLGSVTTKVLHDLHCPVLTTVHSETLAAMQADNIRAIVCGLDLSSEPGRVLKAASDFAETYGSQVRITHAIPAPEAKLGSNIDPGLKRFLFDTAKEQIAECQQQLGTNWDVFITAGKVSCVLLHTAFESQAGLLVIGRGHIQEHVGRFRTHVGAIVRDAPCPVLSV